MPSQPCTPIAAFLQQAIDLATKNVTSGRGGPFGAVIVRAGEIVATGVNLVTATNDPTAHAEITAIRRAAAELGTFSLAGCELYSSCEPCPMCLAACYWSRVEAIFFGNSAADAARVGFDDAKLYREVALPLSDRSLPISQVLGPDAWKSFAAWQESLIKLDY
jgi:guanine deaminase